MLKQIFLGAKKIGGHKKNLVGTASECPPWLRACCGGVIMVRVFAFFWLRLPGPGRQPNEPFFSSNIFWKLGYRRSL